LLRADAGKKSHVPSLVRGFPKPLCILFPDTKGIQWVDTDAPLCLTHLEGAGL
jgi:hypothetical protein